MVYEVPKSKKSLKQNRFSFKHDGQTFELPKFKFLTVGQLELMSGEGTQLTGMLSIAGGADTPLGRAFRELDGEQLEGLVEAWQADSGVTLGESKASDDS